MKYTLIYISIVSLVVMTTPLFAANDMIGCDPKTYPCYEKKVAETCVKTGLPWTKNPDLGKTSMCEYPEFIKESIDDTVSCMQAEDAKNSGGFLENLSLSSLGSFGGFRTPELAKKVYRKNMNVIFGCAVIASRQDKLTRLEESIRNKSHTSEIQKSLEKEKKRYETLMTRMNCNQNRTENAEDKIIDRLASSAMKEYCSYTYYLDYMEANIETDFTQATDTDATAGNGQKNALSTTTEQAAKSLREYSNIISSERSRAQENVPKSILAYQEMDRTYIAHILLVIIFDDYLKLRDNLNTYLSAISQTFEKAYNAQDDRQR